MHETFETRVQRLGSRIQHLYAFVYVCVKLYESLCHQVINIIHMLIVSIPIYSAHFPYRGVRGGGGSDDKLSVLSPIGFLQVPNAIYPKSYIVCRVKAIVIYNL